MIHAATTRSAEPRDALWPAVLVGWAIAALVLVLVSLPGIATLRFPDPDDAMRLLEVRDWLSGQSWWDVAQHRLNGGAFPMHWSRLVDLPLAAGIALLDPLVGPSLATRVTMTLVPLVTLLAIMAAAAAITRVAAGIEAARLAVLVVPLSTPIVYQARPLRIDHHGWQVALALAAVLLLIDRPTWRRGALAGASLGTLLTISLEGMPVAAAIAALAALGWVIVPARRGFLLGLAGALFATAVALQFATRGPGALAPACDALSPAWLAAIGVGTVGVGAAMAVERFGIAARAAALACAAAAAGALLHAAAPVCLAGPFATLPPIVYRLWYLQVLEGRPLWDQQALWAALTIGLPLAGLVGSALAWRATRGAARVRWTMLLALLLATTALAILVNRAGATANALAVPGAAALLVTLLARARAIPSPGRRTLATAGALLAASPGQAAGAALSLTRSLRAPEPGLAMIGGAHRPACKGFAELRALAALPPGTVFAPIDGSPEIIATTAHRAIAGGYHRGAAAMERVMRGFTAPPDRARAIVLASGADYLAFCPGLNEIDLYERIAPGGLAARLERGAPVAWLRPVALGSGAALAWRVIRPLPGTPARP